MDENVYKKIIIKKSIAYLLMISSIVMGFGGYYLFSSITFANSITTTDVQRDWYLKTIKNWGIESWTEQTEDDILISNTDWWAAEKDDLRDAYIPGQDQLKETGNWGTYETDEIWTGHTIVHNGFPLDSQIQEMVQYAYNVWGMNLVITIECENWKRLTNRHWDAWLAYGLCQAQLRQHPEIDSDRFKTDRKYQIDECWRMRSTWTPFYWPWREVNWRACYVEVQDRFTILTPQ